MKYLIAIICISFFIACNNSENKQVAAADSLTIKTERYTKSRINSPDHYKNISISKELITDTNIIKECYSVKRIPIVIDFDNPKPKTEILAKNINEKFYTVTHKYEAKNEFGAIKEFTNVFFVDSTYKSITLK